MNDAVLSNLVTQSQTFFRPYHWGIRKVLVNGLGSRPLPKPSSMIPAVEK